MKPARALDDDAATAVGPAPILRLDGVTKRFGAAAAVDGVDLDVRDGEFLTIVGPSGCGKTTLLRMLAGLEQPSEGGIVLRGRVINDLPPNRRPTCLVFQSLALFPHRTVGENIAFPLKMRGVARAAREARARDLMRMMRLPDHYFARNVMRCSGGERQRVALARAFAYDPEILFFDEPLSALDYKLKKTLEKELKDIHKETGKTFIYITHSLTAERPFLNLGLFRDRNYAIGCIFVTLYGMLNFAPVVLLPSLLQQHAGFPDAAIGAFVGWRGVGNGLGFFTAMWLQRLDPRISLLAGATIQTASGYWLMHINLNVDQTTLALNSLMQGFSVGILWVPLTVATFSTLDPKYRPEGSSVFHLLRNLGSSLFISIAVAEIIRTAGANYSRMTEFVSDYNKAMQLPWVTGAWTVDSLTGLARLSKEINRQATMIGFSNAFLLYTALSAVAIPLSLLVQSQRKAATARA